jgi:hypothetical protein
MNIRQDLETFEEAVEKARRQLKKPWLNPKNLERQVPVSKRNSESSHGKGGGTGFKNASFD